MSVQKGVLDCDLIAAFEGYMANVLSISKFSEKEDS